MEQDLFWSTPTVYSVVTRRIVFPFARKRDELTVTIAPEQPVLRLDQLAGDALGKAVLDMHALQPKAAVAPQFVFGPVHTDETTAVVKPGEHTVPVVQLAWDAPQSSYDIEAMMEQAKAPLGTAQVAAGDHTIGFFYRLDNVRFYPLLTVTLPEDLETYQAGEATTDDLIPLLPFQS